MYHSRNPPQRTAHSPARPSLEASGRSISAAADLWRDPVPEKPQHHSVDCQRLPILSYANFLRESCG
eukprot:6090827-Pyramimonas_sp.AAC.1